MQTDSSLGVVLFLASIAFVLTIVSSLILLWFYRRSIDKWMKPSAVLTQGAWPVDNSDHREVEQSDSAPDRRFNGVDLRRRRTTILTYFSAGLCGAIAMAVLVTSFGFGTGLLPWRGMMAVTLVYAWPVLLILSIVVMPTRMVLGMWASSYFVALMLIGVWLEASPRADPAAAQPNALASVPMAAQLLGLWTSQVLPTVAVVLVLNRRLRAVGPSTLVFSVFVTTVAYWVVRALWGVGTPTTSRILAGLGVALAVALPLAFAVNRLWARRYGRKQESDQTITTDAIWALFSLSVTQSLAIGSGWRWAVLGAAPFAIFKLCTRIGFHFARVGRPTRGPELLLLRRFRGTRNSQRLYRLLEGQWRWLGPIHLIGAPDLARYTVTPSLFLDFLSGRLRRAFIGDELALRTRLTTLDLAPDADGRFRVNELFCTEATWRAAVRALIARSTLVVIDARGFSGDLGLGEELQILATSGAESRAVVLYDTDESHARLAQQIQIGRAQTSDPEARIAAPMCVKVEGDERIVLDQLIRRAGSNPRGAPLTYRRSP